MPLLRRLRPSSRRLDTRAATFPRLYALLITPLHCHATWLTHELLWCHAFVAFFDADAALRAATSFLPPSPPGFSPWEVAFSRLPVPAYDVRTLERALRAFRWASSVFQAQELSSAPLAERRLACGQASTALLAVAASAAARTYRLSDHLRLEPRNLPDAYADGLPPFFATIADLLDLDSTRLESALWWRDPSACSPGLPPPCGWLELPLYGVGLPFVPPPWPPVDFTDAYVSAHVLHVGDDTICGRCLPALASSCAPPAGAPAPPLHPEYLQPACLASLLSIVALPGVTSPDEDPEDYLRVFDVCPGVMSRPPAVWSLLMAGVTALARRACDASLADRDFLHACHGGPPPALSAAALGSLLASAALPGPCPSDSDGADSFGAGSSLDDDLLAAEAGLD